MSEFQKDKAALIKFMHSMGFDSILDIDMHWTIFAKEMNGGIWAKKVGVEMVASKKFDSEELWWRPIEVEGSGFTQLFKGTIKELWEKHDDEINPIPE